MTRKTATIVVLNDGESYSSLDGCKIITYNEEGARLLQEGFDPNHIPAEHILAQVDMKDGCL